VSQTIHINPVFFFADPFDLLASVLPAFARLSSCFLRHSLLIVVMFTAILGVLSIVGMMFQQHSILQELL